MDELCVLGARGERAPAPDNLTHSALRTHARTHARTGTACALSFTYDKLYLTVTRPRVLLIPLFY